MRLLTYQGDQVIMTLSVSGSLVSVGTFIHVEILKVNRKQYQRSRLMAVVEVWYGLKSRRHMKR